MKELLSYLCAMNPRIAQLAGAAAATGGSGTPQAATASATNLTNTLAGGNSIDVLRPAATPGPPLRKSPLQSDTTVARTAVELRCFIQRLGCTKPDLFDKVLFFAAGVALTFKSPADVNEALLFTERRGNACFKAAVMKGYIPIRAAALLEPVKYKSDFLSTSVVAADPSKCRCYSCNAMLPCTVADAMAQPLYGGDYEDGAEDGALWCARCRERMYLSGLCDGSPHSDSGKGHNHCTQCPDFGQCIGDIRNQHCRRCGEHYFAGSAGSFSCQCTGDGDGLDGEFDEYEYLMRRREALLSDEEAVRSDDPATLGPFEVAADAVEWHGCLAGSLGAIMEVLSRPTAVEVEAEKLVRMMRQRAATGLRANLAEDASDESDNGESATVDACDQRAATGGSSTARDPEVQQEDFSKLKVPQLKERLKRVGLDTSGRKAALVERLTRHAASSSDKNSAVVKDVQLGIAQFFNGRYGEEPDESLDSQPKAKRARTSK
jgi:hypothetical protein